MKRALMMVGLAAILALPVLVQAQDEKKKEDKKSVPQTICPVTNDKIDKTLFVEKDGKRIYLCCAGCVTAVEKDFAKYEKQLTDAGVAIEKAQTTCPVMDGNKIDKTLYVDSDGKRIYLCCRGCIGPVKKDPAKYIKKLEDAGITLEPAPIQAVRKGDAK